MRAQSLELHMEFDLSKYQTEMTPKTVWHFSGITQKIPQCLKITENVSFYIASEASNIYIFSAQKLTKSAKKWFILASFCRTKVSGQTVLPDRSILIGQKLVESAKIQNIKCDILGDFQTM